MDKLDKEKQKDLRKMSDVRLAAKLTQAGFNAENIEAMDREAMLNNYAEVVLGISAVKPGAAVAAGVVAPYDAELERRKLDLQARQWKETKARWEAERLSERLKG